MTATEFEEVFGTEERCVEYLRRKRWPDGFQCPRCGGRSAWPLRTRPLDQCRGCSHQVSLTAGTLFHGTRKPLVLWFRVIARFLTSKSGCSALEISGVFGLSYETAWTWLHKLRRLMDRSKGLPLDGWIEADESYVGGRRTGVRGRQHGNKVLLGAIEQVGRGSGRLRFGVATSAAASCIAIFMKRSVEVGAHVRTDAWNGYRVLPKLGFDHAPTRLTVGNNVESERRAAQLFPRIHRAFSLFKRVLLGTYQGAVSGRHLQAYADEFSFRFNRRTSASRFLLVDRLLDSASRRVPIKRELFSDDARLIVGT